LGTEKKNRMGGRVGSGREKEKNVLQRKTIAVPFVGPGEGGYPGEKSNNERKKGKGA